MQRIISFILFLTIAISVIAQCSIFGRFVDVANNHQPISDGVVTLTLIDSKEVKQISTDSLGYFKTELSPGEYQFLFEATGFKTLKGSITLPEDRTDLGNIPMRREDTIAEECAESEQYTVYGKVADLANSPIEFAAVRFLTADSVFVTGMSTDSIGRFTANLPARGEYRMIVSAMGYSPVTKGIKVDRDKQDISIITLEADNKLAEVSVSAGYMKRVDGYLSITPEKILVKHASTGYQLLNNLMLPGMDVEPFEGKVSLFGHDVSLYINGQPADYRMVQNLRPKDIQKIEYHDAPVGRYAQDFAAINFITKERRTGGYVTLDAQQTVGGYLDGRYNGFSKISSGRTSYYLFAGYNLKSAAADRETVKEDFNLPALNIERDFESSEGRNRNHGAYGQFTVENAAPGRFVSLSAAVVSDRPKSMSQGSTVYHEPLNTRQNTLSNTINTSISPKFSYYGQFNTRGKDLLITTFNASYSHNERDYDYMTDDGSVYSDTRDKVLNLSTQLLYQMDLKHRNSISFILTNIFKNASTEYLGTYASTQKVWNSETLALAEYTHRVSDKFRLTARPGFSVVNINLHGYGHKNFFFPRFYTQFTYTPARRQQVNLSFAVGNSRASLSSRTAAEQPIDLIMSRRGNPDLKDVKLYDVNVNYSIQLGNVNLNSLLGLSYQADAITAGYVPKEDRLIIDVYNGNFKRARFATNATWKITSNLRGELGGELSHQSFGNWLETEHLNLATASLSLMYFINDFSFSLKGTP